METPQNEKIEETELVGNANETIGLGLQTFPLNINFWEWKAKYFAYSYILCVPIFAFIYAQIPNDFYHTTVKFEQDYQDLMTDFSKQFTHELRNLSPKISDDAYLANKAPMIFSYQEYIETECIVTDVKNFEIVGNELKFDAIIFVNQNLKKDLNYKGDKYKAPFKKTFYSEAQLIIDFSKDRQTTISVPEKVKTKANEIFKAKIKTIFFEIEKLETAEFFKVENLDFDYGRLIFDKPNIGRTRTPYSLYLTEDGFDQMMVIYNVLRGFPSDLKGNFTRHLYLSATTITTLGLGDIYPITSRARILITIETLLGIIFTGLFLNAVARAHNPS